jgi:hypothetical protein
MKIRPPLVVFVYIVSANVPLWAASRLFGLQLKGWFNIELAALGILALVFSRLPVRMLFLCAIVLDIVSGISWTYMLTSSDLLQSRYSVGEYVAAHAWSVTAIVFVVAAGTLVSTAVLSRLDSSRDRRTAAVMLGAFIAFCLIADIKTGQIRTFHPDSQGGTICWTREPLRLIRHAHSYQKTVTNGAVVPFARASTMLIDADSIASRRQQAKQPNVVLVLVESWGKPLSREVGEALVRPYMSDGIRKKYTVSQGAVGFFGATVAGEGRELCGSTIGFEVIQASSAQLKNCLPAWFRQMNYHTTAVHGFTGAMFERRDWYARAGFEERWFREGLETEGLERCPGAFPGICDAQVAGWIGRRLLAKEDSPQFVYWVTLNSHLPVPIPNRVENPPACSGTLPTAFDAALCSWYQLIFNVHRSVSELAIAPSSRPTIFIVVGDHAPPFSSDEHRSQFSGSVVPYVVLMPKEQSDAVPPRSIAAAHDLVRSQRHERRRVRPIHLAEARYDPGL